MTTPPRNKCLVMLAVVAAAGSGCALLEVSQTLFTNKPVKVHDPRYSGSLLPPIPQPKEAIQLDIVFVERPRGDALLQSALWQEIDEAAGLDPEVRTSLRENGLRAGIGGSSPSRAVQALLGLSTAIPDESSRLAEHQALVSSGGSTIIPCTLEPYANCSISRRENGETETADYENAQCVLRVTAHRLQEGWVRLDFQPEIHHDARRLRPTATNSRFGLDWNLQESQKVETCYGQRFSLQLNMGEIAVVGAAGDRPESLGHHFFMGTGEKQGVQRALVIRLADMVTARPVRVKRFGIDGSQ